MKPLSLAVKKRTFRQLGLFWILPLIVLAGWKLPLLGYFIPLCMIAGAGMAVFKGRYWCNWLCPRGSACDVALTPVSRMRKIPAVFRNMKFRVAVMAVLMTVIGTQLPRFWPSVTGMGMVFVMMLTVTTLIAVLLGTFIHPRNWCVICPIGTLANWLGKGKYPLTIKSTCNQCGKCDTVCPIQVDRWQYRPVQAEATVIPEWDCLKCGLCVEACPRQALTLQKN